MRLTTPSAALNMPARVLRLLAILLLLSGMMASAVRAAAEDAQAGRLMALDRALVLCQPGHAPGQKRAPAPHVPLFDLAVLRGEVAAHAVLAAAPALPAPVAVKRGHGLFPQQARAPPVCCSQAALPRGPPEPV